jgi:hypothetical protein
LQLIIIIIIIITTIIIVCLRNMCKIPCIKEMMMMMIDLQEIDRAWTALIWLRRGTGLFPADTLARQTPAAVSTGSGVQCTKLI